MHLSFVLSSQLGGIVTPNDGKCHLEDFSGKYMLYTKSNELVWTVLMIIIQCTYIKCLLFRVPKNNIFSECWWNFINIFIFYVELVDHLYMQKTCLRSYRTVQHMYCWKYLLNNNKNGTYVACLTIHLITQQTLLQGTQSGWTNVFDWPTSCHPK